MTLLDAVMAGRVLSTRGVPATVPLDFALQGKDRVMFLFAGWWEDPLGWEGSLVILPGTATLEPLGWVLYRDDIVSSWIALPDADEATEIARVRLRQDLERSFYEERLDVLEQHLDDDFKAEFTAWRSAMKARAQKTISDVLAAMEVLRPVGLVVTSSSDVLAVLAVDLEQGYALAGTSTWLASLGSQWATPREGRTLREFIEWVNQSSPHDGASVVSASIIMQEGSLEAIARNRLASTV